VGTQGSIRFGDFRERGALEFRGERLTRSRPDRVECALLFPLAGATAEHTFSADEGAFERFDDFQQGDVLGGTSQRISAAAARSRRYEPCALQLLEHPMKESLRDFHGFCDFRCLAATALLGCEEEQRSNRIVGATRRDELHASGF